MFCLSFLSPHITTYVIPACHLPRHSRMRQLRHPRMLLSGDLFNRLNQRSQTVWEIPDRYFVSSGMTELKIVIPAYHHLRHPRMLLGGDLLNRLYQMQEAIEVLESTFNIADMSNQLRVRLLVNLACYKVIVKFEKQPVEYQEENFVEIRRILDSAINCDPHIKSAIANDTDLAKLNSLKDNGIMWFHHLVCE